MNDFTEVTPEQDTATQDKILSRYICTANHGFAPMRRRSLDACSER